MEDINLNKENKKKASYAWRKRPRRSAPKSRLGCKTCKTRRIKCDLSQPSCTKCKSTGRTCDGYGEVPLAFKTERTAREEICATYNLCTARNWYSIDEYSLRRDNIRPFMILPVTGSAQAEAMSFFENISIRSLNGYRPCESWRKILMFFSQTVPSVRNAALALGLIHRNNLCHDAGDRVYQSQSKDYQWLPDKAPLFHYNRAIHLLLNQEQEGGAETTAITLLTCYLFTCFDHLAGNYVQAMKHLRGGVELVRNIDETLQLENKNSIYGNSTPLGILAVVCQVTKQIRRLDMQAGAFLIDWTPVDIQETFTVASQLSPSGSTFRSLDQAVDHLQTLVAQVMRLRNPQQQIWPVGKIPSISSLKDTVLGQLKTWSHLFENTLQKGIFHEIDAKTYPLVSLLRLQHIIAYILLNNCEPGREMDYDEFLPQFRQCVTLANDVATAEEQYSGPYKSNFTPEIGILPLLYIIGVKCRHPIVRREALSILRRKPIQEAVWNSISAAKVVERVIEIEECAFEGSQIMHSMKQIVTFQRIETLSWIHIVGDESSMAKLDLEYTFCTREGSHFESLLL